MKILGIDPGYGRVGVAVIEKKTKGREILLYSDCIITRSISAHEERLLTIGKEIMKLIKKYKPDIVSVEKLYFNENQKTALKVSEARGVILFASRFMRVPIAEYTPLEIKVACTGYGRADKKQMTSMLGRLVLIRKKIKFDDEYDAIAAALTAAARNRGERRT